MRSHQTAVPNPPIVYGRIDKEGNVYFDDSNLVTFDSSTKTITVDNGALSWAPPILVASKGRFIPV